MSFIYAITNKVNGKKYIGKTNHSIEKRFREHLKDSRQSRCKDRPLYRAINKYGEENFEITMVEEVDYGLSCDREVFWIEHFDTYRSGYNATRGADGKSYLDYGSIISTYSVELNAKKTAEIHGCCKESVTNILRLKDITVKKFVSAEMSRKAVIGDKNGETLFFESIKAAAIYLLDLNDKNEKHTYKIYDSHISRCCRGIRKRVSGFTWRYA